MELNHDSTADAIRLRDIVANLFAVLIFLLCWRSKTFGLALCCSPYVGKPVQLSDGFCPACRSYGLAWETRIFGGLGGAIADLVAIAPLGSAAARQWHHIIHRVPRAGIDSFGARLLRSTSR
jgi:hypothetical protein